MESGVELAGSRLKTAPRRGCARKENGRTTVILREKCWSSPTLLKCSTSEKARPAKASRRGLIVCNQWMEPHPSSSFFSPNSKRCRSSSSSAVDSGVNRTMVRFPGGREGVSFPLLRRWLARVKRCVDLWRRL